MAKTAAKRAVENNESDAGTGPRAETGRAQEEELRPSPAREHLCPSV